MTLSLDRIRSAVRVWHATSSSSQPGRIEACCESWLDDSDRQRASRLRRATTRNQHVVGRGMTRRLLGDNRVQPESIRFASETFGKPFVTEPEEAKRPFNVAHTDGLVMCGIGDKNHQMIGVDVERLDRQTDPEIADRYFSKPEVQYLNTHQCADARRTAFLRIWTLKESFIKAIGTGLQTPLADFAFDQIDSHSPTIRMLNPKLENDTVWNFYSIEPREGFIGAVAVATKHADDRVEIELHSFDELIG